MRSIGAAVIGTGFMGAVHTEALRRAGVTVTGILGSSEAKSRAAAERWGLPRAYRTLVEVLEDRAAHAVHLAVPNRLHAAMARAALEAGKHVMCEKPLAMTAAESAELVALARRHPGQAAGVCYNIRFYPLCIEAREIVRRGEGTAPCVGDPSLRSGYPVLPPLGEIFHVCGSYAQDWLLWPGDYNWRVLAEEGGALRATADIGSHWLDLIHAITGLEVASVCADLQTVHPVRQRPAGEVQTFQGKEAAPVAGGAEGAFWGPGPGQPVSITTDDYGCVMLRYTTGARGSLWVSQVTAGRKNCLRFEIAGAKQSLAWDSERPNELWIGRRDGANQCLIRDPSLVSAAARAAIDTPGGHNEGYADTFKQCFRAFYGYIAAGDFSLPPPFATFADGHREMLLGEAILESSRKRAWVDVKGDRQ